jgi:hypothetical protein
MAVVEAVGEAEASADAENEEEESKLAEAAEIGTAAADDDAGEAA